MKRNVNATEEYKELSVNIWNMIFTQDKSERYFAEKNYTDDKSVGSSDTQALYMVEKEGKDLHDMIKSFNKQLKKAPIYDIDAALIPSPTKYNSPEKNLMNTESKKSPSTARLPEKRRGSFTLTPINLNLERRKSFAAGNTETGNNQLIVSNLTNLANLPRDLDQEFPQENKIQSTPHLEKRINLRIPTEKLNTSINRALPPKPSYIPTKIKA